MIGNPPFESSLTDAGKEIDAFLAKKRGKLPDKQAAYLFLEQAAKLLDQDGRLCLLQPSGFLYNRKTAQFRKHFFRQVALSKRFSISPRSATCSTAPTRRPSPCMPAASSTGRRTGCYHLTFRRTFSATQRIGFELDHYDRHRVPQEMAEDNHVHLAGEPTRRRPARRDVGAFRLDADTLAEFVAIQGLGLQRRLHRRKQRRIEAPFLHNKPLLPTDALTDDGIDSALSGRSHRQEI